MAAFDRAGRYRKEYLPRRNPSNQWREEKYLSKYRLSKERVEWLSAAFGLFGCSRTLGTGVGSGLSYEEQMSLAIRYLATGASFSVIAETQQVTGATVSRVVTDVTNFLYKYSNRFIRWPDTIEDKMVVAAGFHRNHDQKPLIIGCIDGTHVQIISPTKPREAVFINRKGFYSLNVMFCILTSISDSENRIIHLDPTFAGSAADSYVFNASPLKDDATSGKWRKFFLLGDSGYSLKDYFLTPYLHPTNGTERRFNKWHRSTRSLVERTIGLMKQRWRCIDQSGGFLHHTPEKAARIVTACACLHNLALLDRTPLLDHLDQGDDRYVFLQHAPRQPRDFAHGSSVNLSRRDVYARTWFGPDVAQGDSD